MDQKRPNSGYRLTKFPVTLYLVTCQSPNHYYVGVTCDVAHRFKKHQQGKGAKFTTMHGAKSVKPIAVFGNEEDALAAEKAYVLIMRRRTGGVVAGAKQTWTCW